MATGHIRRIAPINQDRTRSGVSRVMYPCKYTLAHRTGQTLFCFPQNRRRSGRPRSQSANRREDYCVLGAVLFFSNCGKEDRLVLCFEENNKTEVGLPKVRLVPPPTHKARVKVGRNDPFPCGSRGKIQKTLRKVGSL